MEILQEQRINLMQQKPFLIWFTGFSGSGKSTLAAMLKIQLFKLGYKVVYLDGDVIRNGLNKDLSFSDKDRSENIRRIGEVAKLILDSGIIVIAAFISPFNADRETVKNIIGQDNFIEIFVDCPINICESRDTKGLYEKARKGELKNFTGIDSRYERPENPSVIVQTDKETVEFSFQKVLHFVENKIK